MFHIRIFILFFLSISSLFANHHIEKVSIQLNWKYQFEYAGFIMAKEKGYYKEKGFDVELKEFNNTTNSTQDIIDNQSTFMISDSLFMIERQNTNIVLLANYFKQSPLIIIANKEIEDIKDLPSKYIMSSKERLKNTPIDFMLRQSGIMIDDLKFKKNSYNIQDLIDNNTDAMEGYKTNELFKLKKENIPYKIFDPQDYGFKVGAINMFTTESTINKYGHTKIKDFINATNKGWEYSLNNINETVNLIYNNYNTSLKKSKEALFFEAYETKKLFLLDKFKIGSINKEELYRWHDILANYGQIEDSNRYEEYIFDADWTDKVYTQKEILIFVFYILSISFIVIFFFTYKHTLLRKQNKDLETLYNIIEEKNEELVRNKKKLEEVLEASGEGIWDWNVKTNIIQHNNEWYNILGLDSNKDQMIDFTTIIHPDDKEIVLQKINDTISQKSKKYQSEHRLIKQDGSIIWVIDKGRIVEFDENNMPVRLAGSFSEITKRKNMEIELAEQNKKLINTERMASMGEMIGNIAHQWRQPLSVISTASTGIIAQKHYNLFNEDTLIDTCNIINNNAQYLSKTIDDFRNFIKGDSEAVNFNMKDDIDSFLKLVDSTIKKNNIEIILEIKQDINIKGFPNELLQCFINIFNNAKDAYNSNKNKEKYFFISQEVIEESVVIKFRDNAGGIPPKILTKVFEPYFTTKHKSQGTGLGLHMVYHLITEGMNGTIEATNVSYTYNNSNYTGAEFIITLHKK